MIRTKKRPGIGWLRGTGLRASQLKSLAQSVRQGSIPIFPFVVLNLTLLVHKGKASAELAPLRCYADLEVYSTPAPTVYIAQFLRRRRRALRLRARGAETEARPSG